MKAKPLLKQQPVTAAGDMGSVQLLEVIQILTSIVNTQDDAIAALEAKFAAIAAITAPTGGATVDSQSRTAINAIRTAAA